MLVYGSSAAAVSIGGGTGAAAASEAQAGHSTSLTRLRFGTAILQDHNSRVQRERSRTAAGPSVRGPRTCVVWVRAAPDEAEVALDGHHEAPSRLEQRDELAEARLGARGADVDAVVPAALDVCGARQGVRWCGGGAGGCLSGWRPTRPG